MDPYTLLQEDLSDIFFDKITTPSKKVIQYDNIYDLKWENRQAIQRVYQMWKVYKREPDYIVKAKGGVAGWLRPPSKFNQDFHYVRSEIRDVIIPHDKPSKHFDYFSVQIKMRIDANKAQHISDISDSISYKQSAGVLEATCHFPGASGSSFAVVKMYNDGCLTLSQASDKYRSLVIDSAEEWMRLETIEDIGNTPMPVLEAYENYYFSK